jgi:1,4-alpha-glucan branching enzyme
VAVLARAGLVLLFLAAGCATRPGTRVDRDGFVHLRHRAASGLGVSVVGDFNAWNPASDPMQPSAPGTYEATLRLPPGLYAFAFAEALPDGGVQIATPEEAQGYVEDDLGSRNGLIRVPGSQ